MGKTWYLFPQPLHSDLTQLKDNIRAKRFSIKASVTSSGPCLQSSLA
jgi:hypothetical protein